MNNTEIQPQPTETQPKKDKLGLIARTGGAVALTIAAIGGVTTAESDSKPVTPEVSQIVEAPTASLTDNPDVTPGTVLRLAPNERRTDTVENPDAKPLDINDVPVEEVHTGIAHEDKEPKHIVIGNDMVTDLPAPQEPQGDINLTNDIPIPPTTVTPTPSEVPSPTETPVPTPNAQ